MSAEQTVEMPIRLNKASLGNAERTFAVLEGVDGSMATVAWVPRERITISQQKVGRELSGTLSVNVISEEEDKLLIETESNYKKVRFWLDKKTKAIIKNEGS